MNDLERESKRLQILSDCELRVNEILNEGLFCPLAERKAKVDRILQILTQRDEALHLLYGDKKCSTR